MRAKVKNSAATEVAHGPGKFLVKNKTASAPVFYEVGSRGPTPNEEVKPLATEAAGYKVSGAGPLEVGLSGEESLTGIVEAAGGEQELEILRVSPRY